MDGLPEIVADLDDEDKYGGGEFSEMLPEIKEWRSERDKMHSVWDAVKYTLPDHVHELLQRSCVHLGVEECQVLCPMLCDYGYDHSLGCPDRMEREVSTRDATLLWVKPGRTPILSVDGGGEEWQLMLKSDVCKQSADSWTVREPRHRNEIFKGKREDSEAFYFERLHVGSGQCSH